jgi:iron complex transport system substrate-binding protein
MRSPIATQIVNHALGKVEIPVAPQRVIVLHDSILDCVLALDVKPVGVAYYPYYQFAGERFRGIPPDLVANIPEVGSISQPSLEKILSLKPDLILGLTFQKNSYQLLSAIAPTVMFDLYESHDFKERLRYFAQLLGKQEQAKKALTNYHQRVQQLQQQLGEKLQKTTISVIILQGQNFYTYSSNHVLEAQVIRDIGLRRPPIQQNQKSSYLASSIEMLPHHDADVLFVKADWTKENPEPLSFLKQPIWSTLNAVKNNQVYEVNCSFCGPLAANKIIDDFYKYLVNTS